MNVKVAKEHPMGKKELRKEFCETLISMAEQDNRVVVLDADLMNAAGTKPFRAAFPERTFDCGVQEANMVGVAAGLSSRGFIPFTHTFGPFAARRACDQIFMSCAYAKQNVKVVGSDPGITAALNGGTHMPFEDMGIMSTIPEMTVVEPCDAVSVREVTKLAKETYGTWYIRLHRKEAPVIYEDGTEFEVGKAHLLREGKDVTIVAIGYLVAEALKAAEELEKEGFVVSQTGIGTFVSAGNAELLRDSRRRLVEQKMQDMIETARSLGITKEELNEMMDILYEEE